MMRAGILKNSASSLSKFASTSQNVNLRRSATAHARFFATAEHDPPKKIHGVTGRYASAVYTAASKAGMLEQVEAELKAVGDIVSKTPGFAAFLENPTISRQEKIGKVGELLDEKKFSHISRNLFLTLSANGRIGDSAKVTAAYEELMQAARGAVKVTIISAEPLKKKQLEEVQTGIMKLIESSSGSKAGSVDIAAVVEPSILGGLQVMVGDRFLDLSVASRVTELSKSLEGAGV